MTWEVSIWSTEASATTHALEVTSHSTDALVTVKVLVAHGTDLIVLKQVSVVHMTDSRLVPWDFQQRYIHLRSAEGANTGQSRRRDKDLESRRKNKDLTSKEPSLDIQSREHG